MTGKQQSVTSKAQFTALLFLPLLLMLGSCVYRDSRPNQSLLDHYRTVTQVNETAPPAELVDTSPLVLSLEEAVLLGLEQNETFQVSRLRPAVIRTSEDIERAQFDPTFAAEAGVSRTRDDAKVEDDADEVTDTTVADGEIGLRQRFPTGTSAEITTGVEETIAESRTDSHLREGKLDITITQALLQGRGLDVNLAQLRQAKLDTRISLYELRGAAEALVANIEEAYWNYILARRAIAIFEQSLKVAELELQEKRDRDDAGVLAKSEIVAAEAEVALRKEFLIEARGSLAKRKLALIRLLNPGGAPAWGRDLQLTDAPELGDIQLDEVASHVQLALRKRPDLNQARLLIQHGELDVVQTRNGLLPKLDLFISLGGSRYANSFSALGDEDGRETSYAVGIIFEFPIGNRDANARHKRAILSLKQLKAAMRNLEQLIQVDVRSAYVDVQTAQERIKATKATRILRQQRLDNEREKLKAGSSTNFQVSEVSRDLLESELAELEAIIDYRKALLVLYRLEGALLERRGIKPEQVISK